MVIDAQHSNTAVISLATILIGELYIPVNGYFIIAEKIENVGNANALDIEADRWILLQNPLKQLTLLDRPQTAACAGEVSTSCPPVLAECLHSTGCARRVLSLDPWPKDMGSEGLACRTVQTHFSSS